MNAKQRRKRERTRYNQESKYYRCIRCGLWHGTGVELKACECKPPIITHNH